MFQALFKESKAAQAVAYLLRRAGGSIELLKLMKLMYLSERLSYEQYGEPMTGDSGYSLPHGPVLSHTLRNTDGQHALAGEWAKLINPRQGNDISLTDGARTSKEDLLALSDSDFEMLDQIWAKFGHMTSSQLRQYTHDNCPEYESPNLPRQKRRLIRPMKLLTSVGFTEEQATSYLESLRATNRANGAFANLTP